jgi:hypothetical protein
MHTSYIQEKVVKEVKKKQTLTKQPLCMLHLFFIKLWNTEMAQDIWHICSLLIIL